MIATLKEIYQTYILKLGEDFNENDLVDGFYEESSYLDMEYLGGLLEETGYQLVSEMSDLNENNEIEITLFKKVQKKRTLTRPRVTFFSSMIDLLNLLLFYHK